MHSITEMAATMECPYVNKQSELGLEQQQLITLLALAVDTGIQVLYWRLLLLWVHTTSLHSPTAVQVARGVHDSI